MVWRIQAIIPKSFQLVATLTTLAWLPIKFTPYTIALCCSGYRGSNIGAALPWQCRTLGLGYLWLYTRQKGNALIYGWYNVEIVMSHTVFSGPILLKFEGYEMSQNLSSELLVWFSDSCRNCCMRYKIEKIIPKEGIYLSVWSCWPLSWTFIRPLPASVCIA